MNLLISYAYFRRSPKWMRLLELTSHKVRYLIDSGAHSVYNSGESIDFDAFVEFCREVEPYAWQYIQLDVVQNSSQTTKNLERMLELGLKPMPVLTQDMDEGKAKEFVKINPYFCVAGGVTESTPYYRARLERVWRIAGEEARIHGLGFTRGTEIFRTRVYSVDSISWRMGQMYAILSLFDRVQGFKYYRFSELRHKPFVAWPKPLRAFFISSGIPASILLEKATFAGECSLVALMNTVAWLRYQALSKQKGVELFLAISSPNALHSITLALHHQKKGLIDWESAQAETERVGTMLKEDFDGFCQYFLEGVEKQELRNRQASV